jgi:hypothetical protein
LAHVVQLGLIGQLAVIVASRWVGLNELIHNHLLRICSLQNSSVGSRLLTVGEDVNSVNGDKIIIIIANFVFLEVLNEQILYFLVY